MDDMAKQVESAIAQTEHKIEEFAEDFGKLLGHARNKAEGWIDQRAAITKRLTDIRDTASRLLTDLGHQAQEQVANVTGKKPGRPPGSGVTKQPVTVTADALKKRIMSPEARKAISKAQKARWASMRATQKN